jgi:tRNA(fMet)-specific endonuclease VapC
MNGNIYLLDTNAIIALLQGNTKILNCMQSSQWVGISIINEIEFLAFPNLNSEDKKLFNQFLQRVDIVELSSNQIQLIELIIKIRQKYSIKLPDAIIAATAIKYGAKLITSDKQFKTIKELEVIEFTL